MRLLDQERTPLDRWDAFFLGMLLLVFVVHTVTNFMFAVRPFDDAAMLFRYAQHVAQGHGIVWNIGEGPVEGATDFLYMIVLAAVHRAGIPIEQAAVNIGLASHGTTIILVYFSIRCIQHQRRSFAMISATFVAFGPALAYTQGQFGTTFFVMFVGLSWLALLRLVEEPANRARSLLFAVSCLVLALIRPDGALLAAGMFVSVLYSAGIQSSRKVIRDFLFVFVFLGGLYFVWRWKYFDNLLPLPLYKKGSLWPGSLSRSYANARALCFPFGIIFLYSIVESALLLPWRVGPHNLRSTLQRFGGASLLASAIGALRTSSPANEVLLLERYSPSYATLLILLLFVGIFMLLIVRGQNLDRLTRLIESRHAMMQPVLSSSIQITKGTLIPLLPVASFIIGWGFLSHEMNFLMRYQYAVLPLVLMSWPKLVSVYLERLQVADVVRLNAWNRLFSTLGLVVLLFSVMEYQKSRYPVGEYTDPQARGAYEVALELRKLKSGQYKMAVSEAGLLPFYSGWRAIDTWGLNDPWIAREGCITSGYLDRFRPDLIMFSAPALGLAPTHRKVVWNKMIDTLQSYVTTRNYELAAIYGVSPLDCHHYYVRKDCGDREVITRTIRAVNYRMKDGVCVDFSRLRASQ